VRALTPEPACLTRRGRCVIPISLDSPKTANGTPPGRRRRWPSPSRPLPALTVDPESATRRREDAERHKCRVQLFREESGAAGLAGRDMPSDQTLAAHAKVCARAQQYQDSGVFDRDTRMDQFRVAAYLDLLNGVPASLPARVNLMITAARLAELAEDPTTTGPLATGPPGGPPWTFFRDGDAGPPGGPGTWTLTLPDGRNITAEIGPMPTLDCDHRHESHAYQPNDRLRHFI
jgi:hypothetical protein